MHSEILLHGSDHYIVLNNFVNSCMLFNLYPYWTVKNMGNIIKLDVEIWINDNNSANSPQDDLNQIFKWH